ncbi:unnamed protein product, partial [Meganyctiphanes norvegica]
STEDGTHLVIHLVKKTVYFLMEEGPRRSNRVAKPLREPGFVYDSNSENYLVGNSSECLNQWSMSDAVIYRTPSTVSISEGYSAVTTTVSWVNSHTVPSVVNAVSHVQQFGGASSAVFWSASQDSNSNDEEFEVTSHVNKVHGKEQHSVQDVRRNSSTRCGPQGELEEVAGRELCP